MSKHHPMNILIAKLSSIGDVIHTLPALSAIREAWPKARIGWIIERRCAELLEGHALIDELFIANTRAWRQLPFAADTRSAVAAFCSALRRFRATVGLDFQGLYKSAFALWLADAPRRIGFESSGLKERLSSLLLTDQVAVDLRDHVIRKNLRLIEHLGIEPSSQWRFLLPVSPLQHAWADEACRQLPGEFAILNLNASWKAKQPEPGIFGAVSRHLRKEHGLWSIIPCGPQEGEHYDRVIADHQINGRLIPCTLLEFAALASRAKLYVGGDTGLTHIAIARGTPVVALYGPTEAWRNGPFDPSDVALQAPSAEPGYYSRRRQADGYLQVSSANVCEAIDRRLNRMPRITGAISASNPA